MEKITFQQFKGACGSASIILLMVSVFLTFKLLKGIVTSEYIIILVTTILCLIAIFNLVKFSERMLKDTALRMSGIQIFLLGNLLIFGLGVLTIYLFAYKGVYGIFQLFSSFSWTQLLLRIIVLVASAKLAESVAKIQEVLKWLSYNTWD